MDNIDYNRCFECLDRITGLPIRRKGRHWYGACRINGERHPRHDKLICSRDPSGGITILEQGNTDVMQLWRWCREYGGMSTDKEVADHLRAMGSLVINIPAAPAPHPALYVPTTSMDAACRSIGFIEDNLFAWLCTKFSRDKVINAFKRYNVSPHRLYDGRIATQFWYVDEQHRVCHDKMMVYHENGRRNKDYGGGRLFKTGDGYSHRCYFGEHLGTSGLVYVVESEKTAILVYLDTGRHCIATGGAANISRMRPNYRLMPDYDDAGMQWVDKFPPEMIVKWWENPRNSDARPGDDMGDVIYRRLMNYE